MAAKKKSTKKPKSLDALKAASCKRAVEALKVPSGVKTVLLKIKEEVEGAHAERFDLALSTVKKYIHTLPLCGAEDMGGHPCCDRIGTYGPSDRHVKEDGVRADKNHYCDMHSKMSFRGRREEDSQPLPFAELVRWAFTTQRESTFGCLSLSTYKTSGEYFKSLSACFDKKHTVREVDRLDGNDDMACWDCDLIHRNPDPL